MLRIVIISFSIDNIIMKQKLLILLFYLSISFCCCYAQTGLFTYDGGYFIRDGNTWVEYRPAQKDDVWATYTQYGEETNFYNIYNNYCSLSIPKEAHNKIYIRKNNDWEVIYNTRQIYNEFTASSRNVYCYEDGYFVRNGDSWEEYRPTKRAGVWNSYTKYSEDDNYIMIQNSQCKVAVPKVDGYDFYILENNEWVKCYEGTNVYDPFSGFDFNMRYESYNINDNSFKTPCRLSFDRKGNGEIYFGGNTYSFKFSTVYTKVIRKSETEIGFELELKDGARITVLLESSVMLENADETKTMFMFTQIEGKSTMEKVNRLIKEQSFFK